VSPGNTLKSGPGPGLADSPRTTATTVRPISPWSAGAPSACPAMWSS
jgi:hypothetical protein